nr:MAG TPA: hypothetical protein [Caudoviricetes sp.]
MGIYSLNHQAFTCLSGCCFGHGIKPRSDNYCS